MLRETDAGARNGVATDGLSGGVGRGRALSHGLHELRAGIRWDDAGHGIGEDGRRSGGLWSRVPGGRLEGDERTYCILLLHCWSERRERGGRRK